MESDVTRTAVPVFDSFHSVEPDEARAFWEGQFDVRAVMADPAPGERFEMRVDVMRLGPIETSVHRYSTSIIAEFDYQDAYACLRADLGRLVVRQDGVAVSGTNGGITVSNPASGPVTAYNGTGSGTSAMRIDAVAVRSTLETLLERPIRAPLRFVPRPDVGRGAGRAWLHQFDLLVELGRSRDSAALHPIVAAPLTEALLAGMLLAFDHPYREQLEHPARCHPRTIKNAVDAIHANPEHTHTVASLALLCGVSPRTLQDGFRRHLDVSPMSYLRHVRLDRAHDDLRSGRAGSVSDAAQRWGLSHLGRFAAAYRHRYGIAPSATYAKARAVPSPRRPGGR